MIFKVILLLHQLSRKGFSKVLCKRWQTMLTLSVNQSHGDPISEPQPLGPCQWATATGTPSVSHDHGNPVSESQPQGPGQWATTTGTLSEPQPRGPCQWAIATGQWTSPGDPVSEPQPQDSGPALEEANRWRSYVLVWRGLTVYSPNTS